MQKQIDGIAIGVIIFGVLAGGAIFYFSNNKMPAKPADPPVVKTNPIVKPDMNTMLGGAAAGAATGAAPGAGAPMGMPMGGAPGAPGPGAPMPMGPGAPGPGGPAPR